MNPSVLICICLFPRLPIMSEAVVTLPCSMKTAVWKFCEIHRENTSTAVSLQTVADTSSI